MSPEDKILLDALNARSETLEAIFMSLISDQIRQVYQGADESLLSSITLLAHFSYTAGVKDAIEALYEVKTENPND